MSAPENSPQLERLGRALAKPWWGGVAAILNALTLLVATALTIYIFISQEQQRVTTKNNSISHIRMEEWYIKNIIDIESRRKKDRYLSEVTLVNSGPAVAPIVYLTITSGYHGVVPFVGTDPGVIPYLDIMPHSRAHVISSTPLIYEDKINSSKSYDTLLRTGHYGGCEHRVSIENWQVGEYISFYVSLSPVENSILDKIMRTEDVVIDDLKRHIINRLDIYQHETLKKAFVISPPEYLFSMQGGRVVKVPGVKPVKYEPMEQFLSTEVGQRLLADQIPTAVAVANCVSGNIQT